MDPIRVVVQGASGKMGQEVVRAVHYAPDMRLVGAVEAGSPTGSLALPDGSGTVPFSADLEDLIRKTHPEVVVDFTIARATMPAVRVAAALGVNLVSGTTGLSAADLEEIKRLATQHNIGVVVASNFALGAIVMMHLAKIAAKYFDNAEIIELHHGAKADAPSGTALSTARAMGAARGKPFQQPAAKGDQTSRGLVAEGINLHSVRLPGLMAHQEIILGAAGQTLTIRHDTISRECYMPGVMLAIKEVVKRQGLVYGLDVLLGL